MSCSDADPVQRLPALRQPVGDHIDSAETARQIVKLLRQLVAKHQPVAGRVQRQLRQINVAVAQRLMRITLDLAVAGRLADHQHLAMCPQHVVRFGRSDRFHLAHITANRRPRVIIDLTRRT